MTHQQAFPVGPLLLPFGGVEPRFANPPRFPGSGASVLGKADIGSNAVIAAGAVIRADMHFVRIGDDFSIGENSTVHITRDIYPAIVGHRTAAGRNTVIHACTVGDDCIIEDNTVILDGSVLGNNILIEAQSVVFPKSRLDGGFVYSGMPAKPVRELTPEERAKRAAPLREAALAAKVSASGAAPTLEAPDDAFVALTARLSGRIVLAKNSSVFFGCVFDAGDYEIVIGEKTNVQDNTVIACASGGVEIGRDVTVGHNVRIGSCRIGTHVLLGIGSTVADGTIVQDGVMLAAGAVTLPGQTLESGWLWGGRPARPLSRLDDARRAMMGAIVNGYSGYAAAYRETQASTPRGKS